MLLIDHDDYHNDQDSDRGHDDNDVIDLCLIDLVAY